MKKKNVKRSVITPRRVIRDPERFKNLLKIEKSSLLDKLARMRTRKGVTDAKHGMSQKVTRIQREIDSINAMLSVVAPATKKDLTVPMQRAKIPELIDVFSEKGLVNRVKVKAETERARLEVEKSIHNMAHFKKLTPLQKERFIQQATVIQERINRGPITVETLERESGLKHAQFKRAMTALAEEGLLHTDGSLIYTGSQKDPKIPKGRWRPIKEEWY